MSRDGLICAWRLGYVKKSCIVVVVEVEVERVGFVFGREEETY